MKKIFLIFGLSILLCLTSCDEDKPTQQSNQLFITNDFPLKEGNWWKYQFVDSNNNKIDTILLILKSKQNNNGLNRCYGQFYLKDSLIGNLEIISDESKISFNSDFGKNKIYFSDFNIITPTYLDSKWENGTYSIINSESKYEVLGNKYDVCYIKRIVSGDDYFSSSSFYLSQNIGLVSHSDYSMHGFIKNSLTLIDYHLNK